MKSATIKKILQTVLTVSLIAGLGFFIKNDFVKLQGMVEANPLMRGLIVQREQVKHKAMMITINHYRPDLSQWKVFLGDHIVPDQRFLNDSVQYYQTISDYVPDIAETQHLLGACHYLLGYAPEALISQQKAVILEPRFFWAWYNLGLMYYQQGDFSQSARAFEYALRASPVETMRIVRSSKIFVEILRSAQAAESLMAGQLENGYRNAARLLEASVQRLRGQTVNIPESELRIKLF